MSARQGPPGLLLSDDLIFTSRIVGTAEELGFDVTPVRSSEALLELARRQPPRCVILDLANPNLIVAELLRELRAACPSMPFLVAYGAHVDAAALKAARDAGCDIAWPRSKFALELPQALPRWLAAEEG